MPISPPVASRPSRLRWRPRSTPSSPHTVSWPGPRRSRGPWAYRQALGARHHWRRALAGLAPTEERGSKDRADEGWAFHSFLGRSAPVEIGHIFWNPVCLSARSLSEYLLVLSHGRRISLGFGLFGLGLTLCAHYPPQSTPTLQERRQIFKRLWVKQISCHSADTFSRPRNRNLRIPRADLIMPNTGSTMCLRAA